MLPEKNKGKISAQPYINYVYNLRLELYSRSFFWKRVSVTVVHACIINEWRTFDHEM